MKRKTFMSMFTFLTIMGCAFLLATQADALTFSFGETMKFKQIPSDLPEEYFGPQTPQALMNVFDAEYNRAHLMTTITISVDQFRQSSQFTNKEIDARYPRDEWLKVLLDKGFTIQNFRKYASCLTKRHILAFLEDNPDYWKTGFHGMTVLSGMPVTDDWETYKTAYIDKLVNKHIKKIRKAAEQVEQAKIRTEQAKVRAEQAKARAERAKNQFNLQQLENVRKQIERLQETIKRLQESIPSPQNPQQKMKKKPSTIQI